MCEVACLEANDIQCKVVFPGEEGRTSVLFTNMATGKGGGIYRGSLRLGEWHSADIVRIGQRPVTHYAAYLSVEDLNGKVSVGFETQAPRTRLFDLLFASGAVDVLCAFLQAAQENPLFRMHVQTTGQIPHFTGKYTPTFLARTMSDAYGMERKPNYAFGKESPEDSLLRLEAARLTL